MLARVLYTPVLYTFQYTPGSYIYRPLKTLQSTSENRVKAALFSKYANYYVLGLNDLSLIVEAHLPLGTKWVALGSTKGLFI